MLGLMSDARKDPANPRPGFVLAAPKRWNPWVKALVVLTVGSFALFGAFVALISFIENHVSLYATVESPSHSSAPVKATGSLAEPLSLEGTTYKVTDVRRAQSAGSPMNELADGTFVIVDVELTNETQRPATIRRDALTLAGGDGATYRTSDDAMLALGEQFLLEAIQPGVTAKGALVYDVPRSAIKGADLRIGDDKGRLELGL